MRKCFFIILIFISVDVHAQNQTIDSLKKKLLTQKPDTNKVNTLNEISSELRYKGDFKNQLQYAENALSIASKLNFKRGKAEAFLNIEFVYFELGNYSEALKNIYMALKLFEEISDKKNIAHIHQLIGGIYIAEGNYSEALTSILLALKERKEILDSSGIAQSLNSLGDIYLSNGNFNDALQVHTEALKISSKLGNRGSDWGVAYCYESIALVFESQGDWLFNNGDMSFSKNKYSVALKYYLLSLEEWKRIGRKDGIAEFYLRVGNVYIKKGNLVSAKKYLLKGFQLSKEAMDNEDIKFSYQSLSSLDSIQGNFKQAYENYKMYILFRDSLVNEDSKKKSLQASMQYDFDKKESAAKAEQDKKDAIANSEIQKQKLVRNFSFAGIASILLFGTYGFYNFRKRKKLENQQSLSNERLRISRDLHDEIGSTLGSISVYSEVAKNRSGKNEKADEVLTKIGFASRELIDKMSDIVWSLNPENETFEHLKNRMLSFGAMILTPHNIAYDFLFDEQLKNIQLTSQQRKNIFLIYKEAIYNAVKYADATEVKVNVKVKEKLLAMEITDNGKGFDSNNTQAYNGNGLKNMKARADDSNAELNIDSKINEGVKIELKLNVETLNPKL